MNRHKPYSVDYPVAKYLLLTEPHEALHDEIIRVKKHFSDTYDCPLAAGGRPNMTLIRFEQYEMQEERIIHRLQLLTNAQHSFIVELEGFGSFPTHSIFIKVSTKTQIVELVKSFRPLQQLLKIDKDRKPHFITEPHIPLAAKLLPWQYEKGWLELSNTHFSGRFVVNHLLLLRKREGENRFETIKKIALLNRKTNIIQGDLFR
ncbi:MAG: hypothetical protein RLZZ28_2093 [Bacteroidota bacterium]|jgi:2'-5' RNA ligase